MLVQGVMVVTIGDSSGFSLKGLRLCGSVRECRMAAAAAAAASVCDQLKGDERLAPVVTSFSWHPWKVCFILELSSLFGSICILGFFVRRISMLFFFFPFFPF